jgi:succinyl-CoA synthetase beta subunit
MIATLHYEHITHRQASRGAVSRSAMATSSNPLTIRASNKAIIAYLGVIGASNTAAAFREEANISASFDDATRKKYEGLLEKKWTSVVRLQKKVACLGELQLGQPR